MKKIRFNCSKRALNCLIVPFYLLFLITKATSSERVNVCEFEDVNIIFPNTPKDHRSDITAKTWNNENGIRLASWMSDTNFVASESYGNRLMAIGENSIKIRNATKADTGRYTLVLTLRSTPNFIEFMVELAVLVPPTNNCVPNITREDDTLMVELPQEGCGIPGLKPRWINHPKNLNYANILKLDPDVRLYTACAEGEAIRCFHGNSKQLCANYSESRTANENEPANLTIIILPLAIIISLIIAVTVVVCFVFCRRRSRHADHSDGQFSGEQHELLPRNDSKGLKDIKLYLINKYKTINGEFLPIFGEDISVDISEVYTDLEISGPLTDDAHGTWNGNGKRTTTNFNNILKNRAGVNTAGRARPDPVVILGQCGTGKSTWCKYLVQKWCMYHENTEFNRNLEHANVIELGKFEILLFVSLQDTLNWSTFGDLLQATLFDNATNLFHDAMKYLSEHGESVLIVLDGLDAVTDNLKPIVNLLNDSDFFRCTIILTSRQDGLKSLRENLRGTLNLRLFQLHGMSLDRAYGYAARVLKLINSQGLTIDSYWNSIRDLQVQILCQIPFIGFSLIVSFTNKANCTKDMTDILLTIIECHIRRAKRRKWFKDNIVRVLTNNVFDISEYINKTKDRDLLKQHGYLLKVLSLVAETMWHFHTDSTEHKEKPSSNKTKKHKKSQLHTDKKKQKELPLHSDKRKHKEGINIENVTSFINEECVQLCIETGILIQTSDNIMGTSATNIDFGHILFFDFFVALSLAGKFDPLSTRQIILDNNKHSHIITMHKQLTDNNS